MLVDVRTDMKDKLWKLYIIQYGIMGKEMLWSELQIYQVRYIHIIFEGLPTSSETLIFRKYEEIDRNLGSVDTSKHIMAAKPT